MIQLFQELTKERLSSFSKATPLPFVFLCTNSHKLIITLMFKIQQWKYVDFTNFIIIHTGFPPYSIALYIKWIFIYFWFRHIPVLWNLLKCLFFTQAFINIFFNMILYRQAFPLRLFFLLYFLFSFALKH